MKIIFAMPDKGMREDCNLRGLRAAHQSLGKDMNCLVSFFYGQKKSEDWLKGKS